MVSQKMLALGSCRSVIREIHEHAVTRSAQIGAENVFDFSIGNPSVPVPQKVTDILQQLIDETPAQELHAYTSAAGDPKVRQVVAEYVQKTFGFNAQANYVYMTVGAAASLAITLGALVEQGDEVITLCPYFPEYKVYAEHAGAKFIEVMCAEKTFQLDAAALESAITENTKAVLVNSPNNPSGAVLNPASVNELCRILTEKSKLYGHPIYLVADEPYRELVYGNATVPYLPLFYPNTIVCYSFSKVLSLPGERIGYIALSDNLEEERRVYAAICGAGRALGYVCAPSMMQRVAVKCLGKTADTSVYKTNRDLLFGALTEYGYSCIYPDGAFYLFVKSPEADANAFCLRAREQELLLVPADDFGTPGFVRIAYCVSTEQIQRALPAFQKLMESYQT